MWKCMSEKCEEQAQVQVTIKVGSATRYLRLCTKHFVASVNRKLCGSGWFNSWAEVEIMQSETGKGGK